MVGADDARMNTHHKESNFIVLEGKSMPIRVNAERIGSLIAAEHTWNQVLL